MGKVTKELYETIYTVYKKLIFKVAYDILVDAYLAEDIVQETMAILFKEEILSKLKLATVENMKGYILAIAKNSAIDEYNRRKRFFIQNTVWLDIDGMEVEKKDYVSAQCLDIVDRIWIKTVVERLSKGDREILKLRYYEQCSCKEISEKIGVNYAAVRKRLERAKKRFKKEMLYFV